MARRTYHQFCGLSRGLDMVGERWTLLIVRELMSGPKRYTDLADVLGGVGTSLLASRIRQLEQDGIVVRRTLPPPAASQVYELTPVGHELARALVPLAIWGIRHRLGGPRRPGETYRAEWTLVFLAELVDAGRSAGRRAVYQFRIDDSAAQLHVHDGTVAVVSGEATGGADVTLTTDFETLVELFLGGLDPASAVADTRVAVEGDPAAVELLLAMIEPVLSGPER
jgi:DNA-binding HxlR family transcriptional regulator/putative sterol carrier protein